MRELYVVGGSHTTGNPKELEALRPYVDLSTSLIELVMLARRCTGYFEDGQTKGLADDFNGLLTRALGSARERRRILSAISEAEKKFSEYGQRRMFEAMLKARRAGIPVAHLPTEDKLGALEVLRTSLPGDAVNRLESIRKQLGDAAFVRFVYGKPALKEFLISLRDSAIFDNVCAHSRERNVMFIGRDHGLDDFFEKEHNFHYYRVDVSGFPQEKYVMGMLHPQLERKVRQLLGKHGFEARLIFAEF